MKFKSIFFSIFALILVGCSDKVLSVPEIYVKSTHPIFITNINQNELSTTKKSAYVFFKNSSGYQNSLLEAIRSRLINFGFLQSSDAQNADIVILGDFVSLQRFEHRTRNEPRMFMNMGYGFGSRGWRSRSLGLGMMFGDSLDDWDDYERTDYYIYKAVVSVMIRVNGREQSTNIEVQSGENLYSPSYILPFIEAKVADQIINYFY